MVQILHLSFKMACPSFDIYIQKIWLSGSKIGQSHHKITILVCLNLLLALELGAKLSRLGSFPLLVGLNVIDSSIFWVFFSTLIFNVCPLFFSISYEPSGILQCWQSVFCLFYMCDYLIMEITGSDIHIWYLQCSICSVG